MKCITPETWIREGQDCWKLDVSGSRHYRYDKGGNNRVLAFLIRWNNTHGLERIF